MYPIIAILVVTLLVVFLVELIREEPAARENYQSPRLNDMPAPAGVGGGFSVSYPSLRGGRRRSPVISYTDEADAWAIAGLNANADNYSGVYARDGPTERPAYGCGASVRGASYGATGYSTYADYAAQGVAPRGGAPLMESDRYKPFSTSNHPGDPGSYGWNGPSTQPLSPEDEGIAAKWITPPVAVDWEAARRGPDGTRAVDYSIEGGATTGASPVRRSEPDHDPRVGAW